MSGFPQFLNPGPALWAAAIAVPLLLVLYFLKLRRPERLVSSTVLWRKAILDLQVNAPFQRLRRNLLLLLQLLLMLLLCLALARPVSNNLLKAGKRTLILIDRSASMAARDIDGHSRLDEAKQRAKALVGTMERGTAAAVIEFSDSAMMVQPFTTDPATLRSAIDGIEQTDRRSRLKLAYQMVEASGASNEPSQSGQSRPEVFVFSDGRVADAKELKLDGDLHFVRIGSDQADNIAIVSMSAKRNYERPTEVQIFARLANYGSQIVKPMVQLSIDGQSIRVASAVLFPESWTDERRKAGEQESEPARDSVEFSVELDRSALVKVEQMQKDRNALTADDAAFVVVPPPKPLRVMLVTGGNYFLEKAIQSLNLKDPAIVAPGVYESAFKQENNNPGRFDVILFDRYRPRQLPPAGSFIYFGVVPPDLKLSMVMEHDKPALLGDVSVLDWKRDHPMLRNLSLGRVYVGEAVRLQVPPEAEVLMEGDKGPLMALYREGRRTHLVVAFDLLQSNWPLRVSFPLFMSNAMQYLAIGSEMDVRQSYPPGSTPRVPRSDLQKVDSQLKRVQLDGPMGTVGVDVPPSGDFVLPSMDRVGVYATRPPIGHFEQLAVNLLDANESNLMPLDHPPGDIGTIIAGDEGKSRMEWWWWIIAVGVLPLLVIEWWVYTRRVHL
ncbi:MAG: VWA domain-containing protein [Phycisphaerales bacterium]|nr:VWA domain-containing protein [Phycisphaerales bacterium]